MTDKALEAILIYPSDKELDNFSLDDLYKLKIEQQDEIKSHKYGMLSIEDYMVASLKNTCKTKLLDATGCDSWLAEYKGWTTNLNAEHTTEIVSGIETPVNYAYYFASGNKLEEANVTTEKYVYPILNLNRDVLISYDETQTGGTTTNPYVVQ